MYSIEDIEIMEPKTLKELCEMQRKLDTYISDNHNLGEPYAVYKRRFYISALRVEIAEAENETRCFKYWSNKPCSPKPVVLEELADCMHFDFSLINYTGMREKDEQKTLKDFYEAAEKLVLNKTNEELTDAFNNIWASVEQDDWYFVLVGLCMVCVHKGYTAEELEQAYLSKHLTNYQRQNSGY